MKTQNPRPRHTITTNLPFLFAGHILCLYILTLPN